MKQVLKTITVLTLSIAMLINYSYAAKKKGTNKSSDGFKSHSLYSNSTSVLNGEMVNTFFRTDGSLIGMSKEVSFEQIGTVAKDKIKLQYLQNGYIIAESIEFTNEEEESAFYIKLISDTKTIILQVTEGKYVSEFKG